MAYLPSDESDDLSIFDRFATAVSTRVAQAPFFAFAVAIILIWLPTLWLLEINTSQLIVNTVTTIGSWWLLSLLHNSTARSDKANQAKQNAMAAAFSGFLEEMADQLSVPRLAEHATELRQAVGLEDRVSS